MRRIRFEFTTDDDTLLLMEIVVWNLATFFGYSDENAIRIVNKFYLQFRETWNDHFYHEEMPFRVAARMHFVIGEGGPNEDFAIWVSNSKWKTTPPESVQYFKNAYFNPEC